MTKGLISVAIGLVVSRIATYGGNFIVQSGLIRGNLNHSWHGNPELSGVMPKCVTTIYPLPLWGNEIV